MEHAAPESPDELQQERDAVEPQADGDSGESIADEVIVDGRISGLPPQYDRAEDAPVDSPEMDAEIQADAEKTSE